MAEPSPKEEPPPTNFLCKLVSKVPFQMPTCPSIVDTVLREKLGILSPKEIYVPGPEHDNCTLQTDKYYTQGKQKSKENDRKKPEKDGHGAHAHCVRGKCASHSHMTHMPTSQGHNHVHEEGQSYGENLENPINSLLGISDEHDCLKKSHAHCWGASNHSNVDFCLPPDDGRSEGFNPKKSASHNCHGEGSSTDTFKRCAEDHDCCASGSHSHGLHDEDPWKSSEGDCCTLYSPLQLGPSRSSPKDCDSASSSRNLSKKIGYECCQPGSNLHEQVGGGFAHSWQTNGHIHEHNHDRKHCSLHSHSYKPPNPTGPPPSKVEYPFGAVVQSRHTHDDTHDHNCCTAHVHSHKSHEPQKAPPSKAEYLFGTLVPPPPKYSSQSTPLPEYLLYKPEPPKKALVSLAGIGPMKWNRSGENTTNQAPIKQAGSGKVGASEAQRSQAGSPREEAEFKNIFKDNNKNQIHVGQETSRQESTETREEDGLPRLEICEDIDIRPSGTTPRQSYNLNNAALERPVNKASVWVENPERGNTGRIEAKQCKQEDVLNVHRSKVSSDSPKNQQSDAKLPRPTHVLPPTLNSSPGFSGFLWHDESGFLDKNVLEEQYKKSRVLMGLGPEGYVRSADIPSNVGNSAEREESPVEPSVGALETMDSNPTWESFEFLLTDYRVICLVDDSLSMAGRPWLLASEIVPQIALLCAKYSGAEGADIRFVNNLSGKTDQVGLDPRDVRTKEKARNLFPRTPEGRKNPMGLELNKILSPYVRRWKQHGFNNEEKPIDIIILTASSPSDYNFCVKSVVDITKELDKLGAPPAQLCIQFFQINKAPAVTNELKELSEELMRKCTGRKIVSTFLWNEQVEAEAWSAHVVLDCVRKMVDQKIFAAPTKSIAGNKVPSCKCCT